MTTRDELTRFLDDLLTPEVPFEDGSCNGLQVEGREQVASVLFAVDAGAGLIEEACREEADYLVVHHGLIWGGGLRALTGLTAARLRPLFGAGVSLYASHLPLDAHSEVGNNACIAAALGLELREPFAACDGLEIGCRGVLPTPLPWNAFLAQVDAELGPGLRCLDAAIEAVERVGVVSGSGGFAATGSDGAGIDCLITGELAYQYVNDALEGHTAVVAAGHYRTETYGVKALMERVASVFDVRCRFVDLPTGF